MLEFTFQEEPSTGAGPLAIIWCAIDELERRYGSSQERLKLSPEEMGGSLGAFVVARHDAHPVGGIGLRPILSPTEKTGELKRLWVRPDMRRYGVAKRLMLEIEDSARERGYEQLYLETGNKQPEAVALYESIDWEPVENFPEGAYSYPEGIKFTKRLR
jgi:GNAT superfamily N-acetyltransferase